MANNRYLEFVSSYRDRSLYPEPANFVVEISQTGQRDRFTARDPVSNASPILSWNSSFREDAAATFVTITAIDTTFSPSDPTTFIIEAGANQFRNADGFYIGAVIVLDDSTTVVRRRILAYQRISTTQAQITVDGALPNDFPAAALAGTSVIENPTNATDVDAVPKVFIPFTDRPIDNFYRGYRIEREVIPPPNESILITSYDGVTRLATLASNTAATWLNSNLNFVIRKEEPIQAGALTAINNTVAAAPVQPVTTVALSTSRAIQLALTASTVPDFYVGSYLRMKEPVPVAGAFSNPTAPYGEERRIVRYIAGTGVLGAAIVAGTNTFTLNAVGSSAANDFYVGGLITVTNGVTTDIRQIISYTGATRSGTVAVTWDNAYVVGSTWNMRTAILEQSFSINPTVGTNDIYEVEGFTRDNAVPFSYFGTLVSSQQEICCEVELLNLILPNITLASGRGGRPAFYPYLYVELQQVSGTSGKHIGTIYSNNPNAIRMLFRAVVDDTPTPLISPFIKIDSDGMVHTIKFKPNDSFIFSVRHTDGSLFQSSVPDTSAPTEPNPLVQISACFAFKNMR